MNASSPLTLSRSSASFRTSPPARTSLPRAVAMPAWRAQTVPTPPEAPHVVILIGFSRRGFGAVAEPAGRCLHAYGMRGASALCGAGDWRELVPPAETTCSACQARLGRRAALRVH